MLLKKEKRRPLRVQHLVLKREDERQIFFCMFLVLFYKTIADSTHSSLYLCFFKFLNQNLPLPRHCTRSIKITFQGISDFLGISTEVVVFGKLQWVK